MGRGEVTGLVCIEAYFVVVQSVCSLKCPWLPSPSSPLIPLPRPSQPRPLPRPWQIRIITLPLESPISQRVLGVKVLLRAGAAVQGQSVRILSPARPSLTSDPGCFASCFRSRPRQVAY
jgi:hypothetical protein